MSLFTIPITDLLSRPLGMTEEFLFDQTIPESTWESIQCTMPLSMRIKCSHEPYGIAAHILSLKTQVTIPDEEIFDKPIELEYISREFHHKKSPTDTDDIEYIDTKLGTIDLTKVIEQELLIASL